MNDKHDDPIARAVAPRAVNATPTAQSRGAYPVEGETASAQASLTNTSPQGPCFISREDGMAVTLDLEYRTGDREAFPYGLLSRIAFDRSDGITLEYVGAKVEINGARLEPLYRALCGHRVLKISEALDGFAPNDGSAFVESIQVAAS